MAGHDMVMAADGIRTGIRTTIWEAAAAADACSVVNGILSMNKR